MHIHLHGVKIYAHCCTGVKRNARSEAICSLLYMV